MHTLVLFYVKFFLNEIIFISSDGRSGGIGEDLGVASQLKWLYVEVLTYIESPLTPHIIVDHGEAQHEGREEIVRPFNSSAD